MAANNIYIQVDFNSQTAQQNVNALNQAIAQTGPTATTSSAQATKGLNSVQVSVQQVNREFEHLTTALAGLGISRAIGGMVQVAADLNRSQLAMQSFTGSAEEAAKVFEQVRAIAAQSPFRFRDLEQSARELLAFGIAAKNVPDTLRVITDQVARMGGSIEDVNSIVRLFGRIMEKDFVGAMDLVRKLPAEGVPVMKALRAEIEKTIGHPVETEDVRNAIKEGLLDPLQSVRVALDAMRQAGGFGKMIADAAMAFKNLGDTIEYATGKFFGPEGFGPALTTLAQEIGAVLAPVAALMEMLMKLPEPAKVAIVNLVAGAAAVAAFGTALGLLVRLAAPLTGLVRAMWGFVAALAAMNPLLTISVVLVGALAVAAYKLIPAFKGVVDNVVNAALAPIKGLFSSLTKEGQKWYADFTKEMQKIQAGPVIDVSQLWDKARTEQEKFATEARRTLLQALASPVEAVQVKYAELFRQLEEEFKPGGKFALLTREQQQTLRDMLGGTEAEEILAAQLKKERQARDEQTKLDVERVKGSYEAQILYIEAMDEQDLRKKVAAIDQVTALRMQSAQAVANVEKDNLQATFEEQEKYLKAHRAEFAALGLNVTQAIEERREEMLRKQQVIDQKAVDDQQKYRLEGWKKANDAIIEDQKRIYESFQSVFDQIFDAFTNKTKSIGQALSDVFKKLALDQAKAIFATQGAAFATELAGYGRPEGLMRGTGILGQLLTRGMAPRPPGPPPETYLPARTESEFKVAATSGANRIAEAADMQVQAAIVFSDAVRTFAGATIQHQGSADRIDEAADAIERASTATGVPQPLLHAVAQVEAHMQTGLVSPKGAMGLFQLMPGTARDLGVTQPFNPYQSAMGGAQYLQQLLTRYGGDTSAALAAYNMGPAAYDRAIARGRALPTETQNYVRQVLALMPQQQAALMPPVGTLHAGTVTVPPYPPEAYIPPTGYYSTAAGGAEGGFTPVAGGYTPIPGGVLASLGGVLGTSVGKMGGPSQQAKLLNLQTWKDLFGLGGGASLGSFLTSRGATSLAGMAGMSLMGVGLQRRVAPLTVGGGVLAAMPLMQALDIGPGAAAGIGAGGGLLAAGIQRGGFLGLGMDIGGGALAGAAIGSFVPGIGTLVGAGIGAAVGAIAGAVRLLVKTEQEKIRAQIKQVYGIDISNRQILTQIQQIVDQSYGGNVAVGIRSTQVQELVRLYALSTGQAARMPRPMYAATIAQSTAGLQLQPVYQGGVQVANPYTGPTTYQYQTAVASAMGLMPKPGSGLGVPGGAGLINMQWQQLALATIQGNPSAIAMANSAAATAGDSRLTTTQAMQEPLTALS